LTYLNYTDSGDNSYLNNNTYTDEQLDRNFIRSFAHEFAPITNIAFVNWSTRPLDVLLNDYIVAGCKYINPNDKLIISVGSNITSADIYFVYYSYSALILNASALKNPLREINQDLFKLDNIVPEGE